MRESKTKTLNTNASMAQKQKEQSVISFFNTSIATILNDGFQTFKEKDIEEIILQVQEKAKKKFVSLQVKDKKSNFWKLFDEQLYIREEESFKKNEIYQKEGLGLLKIFLSDLALNKYFFESIIKNYLEVYENNNLDEKKLLSVIDAEKWNIFHSLISVLMHRFEHVSLEIEDQDLAIFEDLKKKVPSLLNDRDIYGQKPIDLLEDLPLLTEGDKVERIEELNKILSF